MCGRFTLTTPAEQLASLFDVIVPNELPPRYNVAPSQPVAVVRPAQGGSGGREFALLRWGLIPSWAREEKIGSRLINARVETAAERPAFRDAFRSRRCLIAADGFFEWKPQDRRKQPYLVRRPDGKPFAFAGLWERWRPPRGEPVETCAILTTEAVGAPREIHPRMPVILPPEAFAEWLGGGPLSPERAQALAWAGAELVATPVSAAVNDARFDGIQCIQPAGDDGAALAGDLPRRKRPRPPADQPGLFDNESGLR
ncbi:MAG TPA: SOS response-associated peptidase [Gemmataceae bacterium]